MKCLPTPAEVMDAYSQAASEIGREIGLTVPSVMLRERACEILYHRNSTNEMERIG